MKQDLPPLTVLATFNDRVSAEIACALLSEASIHSGEPEPAEDGTWLGSVRGVHPDLAGRTEVILRSARAREITIASDEQQTVYGCSEHRPQFTSATRTTCRRRSFKELRLFAAGPTDRRSRAVLAGTMRLRLARTW